MSIAMFYCHAFFLSSIGSNVFACCIDVGGIMQSQERYMRDELMCHDLAASMERATFPITTNSYQFHVHFERMELLDLSSEFMTQIPRIWELEMTRTHAAHTQTHWHTDHKWMHIDSIRLDKSHKYHLMASKSCHCA